MQQQRRGRQSSNGGGEGSRTRRQAKQKKHAAKQKKGAENDTISEHLERVMEGRVCADTGVMLYHCRWAGFTSDDDTYEETRRF